MEGQEQSPLAQVPAPVIWVTPEKFLRVWSVSTTLLSVVGPRLLSVTSYLVGVPLATGSGLAVTVMASGEAAARTSAVAVARTRLLVPSRSCAEETRIAPSATVASSFTEKEARRKLPALMAPGAHCTVPPCWVPPGDAETKVVPGGRVAVRTPAPDAGRTWVEVFPRVSW